MNKFQFVVALAFCGLASSSAVGQRTGSPPILGQGNVTCRAWTAVRRADPVAAEARTAWLLGFLTAYSQFVETAKTDVSEGRSTDQLAAWVDEYCGKHPHETLQQAATALVGNLRTNPK
jgi:hypothetical protein